MEGGRESIGIEGRGTEGRRMKGGGEEKDWED